jgi:hypothetical protein
MENKMELFHVVKPKPNIIVRKEKNCYLLVNRENGAILAVNDVGIDIWNQILGRITVKELIERLMKKYNIEFELSKQETLKFIKELLKNGFAKITDINSQP